MSYTMGILINGNAGGGRAERYAKIERYAILRSIPYKKTHDLSDVVPALQYLIVQEKVNLLAIFGGDGAMQKALDVLFFFLSLGLTKDIPALLLLGGGTMRSTLYVCGWFWKSPIAILRKVHSMIIRGKELSFLKRRPLVLKFGEQKHYGFQILGGILGRLGQYMNAGKKRWWVFIWKAICAIYSAVTGRGKAVPFLTPESLEIYFDGVLQPKVNLLGYFFESFSRPMPTMRPWRNHQHQEDEILVIASSLKPWQVVLRLIMLWRGRLKNPKQTTLTVVKKITLHPENNLFFLLEGDDFDIGIKDAVITVSPHVVRLVVK